jgi:hypothetical protein
MSERRIEMTGVRVAWCQFKVFKRKKEPTPNAIRVGLASDRIEAVLSTN